MVGAGDQSFIADDDAGQGANHLNFKLSYYRGKVGLTDANLNIIDKVCYGPQTTNVSEGRSPDGASAIPVLYDPHAGHRQPGDRGHRRHHDDAPHLQLCPGLEVLLSESRCDQRHMDTDHLRRLDVDERRGRADKRAGHPDEAGWSNGQPCSLPNKSGGVVYPTFYFRTHFTYAGGDPSITTLTLTTNVTTAATST